MQPQPTAPSVDLSVSTITATFRLSAAHVDLEDVFRSLFVQADCHREYAVPVLVFVQLGQQVRGSYYSRRSSRRLSAKFDNQVTMTAKLPSVSDRPYWVNLKLFRNGVVHMVGLKRTCDCDTVVEFVADHLRRTCACVGDDLLATDLQIHMINTDFKVGFAVRRNALYELLREKYGARVTYEPTIYSGVKLYFFCGPDQADGVCRHSPPCVGRRGPCKRVTVVVFRGGSVIITGGNDMHQIESAYGFIRRVLETEQDLIRD